MAERVLITGGAGFIGRNLARRMLREGLEVSIYDSFSPQIHGTASAEVVLGDLSRACEVIRADVRDREALRRALRGKLAVVHLAAETGTGQSMYEVFRYVDVNSGGTAVLLDLIANETKGIERIVVASSRAVYGEGRYRCAEHGVVYPMSRKGQDMDRGDFSAKCPVCAASATELPTDEDSALHPTSIYGITKLNQEQLVLIEADALRIQGVALRYQNVYGPGQSLNNPYTGILSIFSRLLLGGADLNIFEDGRESRDFVFIDDVVEATFQAARLATKVTGAFNVGTGIQTTVHEVADALKHAYGSRSTLRVSGNYRLGDIRHNFASLEKTRRALGFTPRVSFADGVAVFCQWVQSQGGKSLQGLQYGKSIEELRARGLLR